MFLRTRPSAADIAQFLEASRDLPLSYGPPGLLKRPPAYRQVDEETAVIGHGADDFTRACKALTSWAHFDVGWVEAFSSRAGIENGTVVAVLIRHFGLWSLNGARVVYQTARDQHRFGFAYGTLTNHEESGEELFEIAMDPRSGEVTYRIRAISWPQSWRARLGGPVVRVLQARFRKDSTAAMTRAIGGSVWE